VVLVSEKKDEKKKGNLFGGLKKLLGGDTGRTANEKTMTQENVTHGILAEPLGHKTALSLKSVKERIEQKKLEKELFGEKKPIVKKSGRKTVKKASKKKKPSEKAPEKKQVKTVKKKAVKKPVKKKPTKPEKKSVKGVNPKKKVVKLKKKKPAKPKSFKEINVNKIAARTKREMLALEREDKSAALSELKMSGSELHEAIVESIGDHVDKEKVLEVETRVSKLMKKYRLSEDEMEEDIDTLDTHRLLRDFDKLIKLVERENASNSKSPTRSALKEGQCLEKPCPRQQLKKSTKFAWLRILTECLIISGNTGKQKEKK